MAVPWIAAVTANPMGGVVRRADDVGASLRAGRDLAAALANGAVPATVPVRFALRPGEACYGQTEVTVLQWLEGEGQYVRKSGGYLFGAGGFGLTLNAARLTANVVGNKARKARAAHDAAYSWRQVEQGRLSLTNMRFAVQGSQWVDIWHGDVRTSDCVGGGLQLQLSGMPPTALQVPAPDYWFVLFNKLAYDKVLLPPQAPGEPYQVLGGTAP
jgi:hypothetical protein